MRIRADTIQSLCPEIALDVVEAHLARLEPAYLERFDASRIAEHLRRLSLLSDQHPVEVLFGDRGSVVECTILAFDHPFEFSLITGVLAGLGFRIESGEVFTLKRPPESARRSRDRGAVQRALRRRGSAAARTRDPHRQPVIIDSFQGELASSETDFQAWSQRCREALVEVITLLDRADEESVTRAKQRVNELVTQCLGSLGSAPNELLLPVKLTIDPVHPPPSVPGSAKDSSPAVTAGEGARTRLNIVAQDTPAFLYSLSTALSLHGLTIERVHIRSEKGRVSDEIFVVDAHERPITDPDLLERVKFSVLLTKQFTYFLTSSPNPFAALTRFERLCEQIMRQPERGKWIDLLSNPAALGDLAKLLGTSDFLWEDFIRTQYESLLPIFRNHLEGREFCPPPETISVRMLEALQGAGDFQDQKDRLNRFKDNEIFLIDLNHILNRDIDSRQLSEHLTVLAENLVAAAARVVRAHLVASFGAPRRDDGQGAHDAVFGLGKLGGVALGYASDIELLFVYDAGGHTAGGARGPISNAEFFEQLVRETTHVIRTKRAGIFEVDLRLRPHGNDGPLACSLEQFRSYYGPGGAAHPLEKLALVRMRWIAGDARLGFEVSQLRDAFVYEHPELNLDALWEAWTKQHEQKMRPGSLNAKYGPGALSDLEGAVQLLQVMFAQKVPQLRTARLREAMEGLRRADVLDPAEFADLSGAYQFLRRLINALRILRGDARDLFLPAAGSDELSHLARRMGYRRRDGLRRSEQLMREFEDRTEAVRRFVKRHFGRAVAGER